MRLSAAGLRLIKQSEGFRSHVYLDPAGYPTIGFGHRLVHPETYPGGMNEAQAGAVLQADVAEAEAAIARLVKVPLTQGQFDALVDFVFNLGARRLAASSLLHKLNAGDRAAAAAEQLRWDHAGDRELAGLKSRRQAEFALWNGTAAKDSQAA